MNAAPHHRAPTRRAFTLIEIMIVVVILGVLAAIVVPSFTNATDMARHNTLLEEVRFMRTQITVYQTDHIGTPPGYPGGDSSTTPTAAAFVDQMTAYSTSRGATTTMASPLYPHGPYLRRMPDNPINVKSDIVLLANGAAFPTDGDDTTGWVYQPLRNLFAPNLQGNDPAGKPYIEY